MLPFFCTIRKKVVILRAKLLLSAWVFGIFVSMEKCLDLALRKGKAGGEPKPTENKCFCKPTVT